MKRHPGNSNLTLCREDHYRGQPIQVNKGPFVKSYLRRLDWAVCRALDEYSRVFAFRFDLRFPAAIELNRPGFPRHSPGSLRNAFQTLPVTADC